MKTDQSTSVVELLNRARGGDEGAREALFEKCRAYVTVVARAQVESWLQAKVDPSGLVQQTLLEAHRGLENFRGATEGEWLAWLRRILMHNAADFVRQFGAAEKRRVGREVPLRPPTGDGGSWIGHRDPSDPGESPSELVLRRERELQIAEAVSKLSDDYREVIMLRNLQRLPFNDVARRMGRSRPAVQMLWMRALCKLQEAMS